jgi:hypothetical protein
MTSCHPSVMSSVQPVIVLLCQQFSANIQTLDSCPAVSLCLERLVPHTSWPSYARALAVAKEPTPQHTPLLAVTQSHTWCSQRPRYAYQLTADDPLPESTCLQLSTCSNALGKAQDTQHSAMFGCAECAIATGVQYLLRAQEQWILISIPKRTWCSQRPRYACQFKANDHSPRRPRHEMSLQWCCRGTQHSLIIQASCKQPPCC